MKRMTWLSILVAIVLVGWMLRAYSQDHNEACIERFETEELSFFYDCQGLAAPGGMIDGTFDFSMTTGDLADFGNAVNNLLVVGPDIPEAVLTCECSDHSLLQGRFTCDGDEFFLFMRGTVRGNEIRLGLGVTNEGQIFVYRCELSD